MAYVNKLGQEVIIDQDGFSQFGFDLEGFNSDFDYDPNQVASYVQNVPANTSNTSSSNANDWWDRLFGLVNKGADVYIASQQQPQYNPNGTLNPYYVAPTQTPAKTGTSGLMIVGIVVGVLALATVITVVVVSSKKKSAS